MEDTRLANSGEQNVAAGPAGGLPAEDFLLEHYRLRRNVLSGKVEYRNVNEDDSQYRQLTDADVNSIILKSRREGYVDKYDISAELKLLIESSDLESYDPIMEYLNSLTWDGEDRLSDLWKRIPGMTAELAYFCSIWIRGVVAQWFHLSNEHGNENVLTLIGSQGPGKTTFIRRLLPPQFRENYFMASINIANKFDRNMALTSNLLVNMDEFNKYTPGQQAHIKQLLSVVSINDRKIYGRSQQSQPRYASFAATSNVRHPLVDPTGSRRHIVVAIPEGMYIDNETPIDYDQLYAQLVHEVIEDKERYWFTNEEVKRIQTLNAPYIKVTGVEKMIEMCVKPANNSNVSQYITTNDIIGHVKQNFPEADISKLTPAKVGRVMKSLGYGKKHLRTSEVYIATLQNCA